MAQRKTKIIIGGAIITVLIGLVILALLAIAGVTVLVGTDYGSHNNSSNDCGMPGTPVEAVPPVTGSIQQQQIANAKIIANTVKSLHLGSNVLLITLTAAVGESSLIVLDHGDAANGTSRGLYQQISSWGSEADRMNPVWSTKAFILGPKMDGKNHGPGSTGLLGIPGWQSMGVSPAIHAVQINADPNHYTPFVSQAEAIAKQAGIDFDQFGGGSSAAPGGGATAGSSGCYGSDPGDVGTGPCPMDNSGAPGHKSPNNCNQALKFEAQQMQNGNADWYRQCLKLVMNAYGYQSGPATARDAAQIIIDAGKMHHTTNNIPRGALLWYDGSATGNPAGHVAMDDGHGYIYSNDVSTPGKVGRVPWNFPVDSWGQKFLGWSAPYFPTGSR